MPLNVRRLIAFSPSLAFIHSCGFWARMKNPCGGQIELKAQKAVFIMFHWNFGTIICCLTWFHCLLQSRDWVLNQQGAFMSRVLRIPSGPSWNKVTEVWAGWGRSSFSRNPGWSPLKRREKSAAVFFPQPLINQIITLFWRERVSPLTSIH